MPPTKRRASSRSTTANTRGSTPLGERNDGGGGATAPTASSANRTKRAAAASSDTKKQHPQKRPSSAAGNIARRSKRSKPSPAPVPTAEESKAKAKGDVEAEAGGDRAVDKENAAANGNVGGGGGKVAFAGSPPPAAAATKPGEAAVGRTPLRDRPGPTPYWMAVEADGRDTSPRVTRSERKKRREGSTVVGVGALGGGAVDEGEDEDEDEDEDGGGEVACVGGGGGRILCFSPPDHKANLERERREEERKEQDRVRRISKARKAGQLLVFSPTSGGGLRPSRKHPVEFPAAEDDPEAAEAASAESGSGQQQQQQQSSVEQDFVLDLSPTGQGQSTSTADGRSEAMLQELEGTIATKNGEILSLRGELAGAREERDVLSREVSRLSREREDMAEALATRAREIEEGRAAAISLDEDRSRLRGEVEECRARIDELTTALEKSKGEAKEGLDAVRQEGQSEMEKKEKELIAKNAELRDLAARLDTANADKASLIEKLSSIEESASKAGKATKDEADAELASLHAKVTAKDEELRSAIAAKDHADVKLQAFQEALDQCKAEVVRVSGLHFERLEELEVVKDEVSQLRRDLADERERVATAEGAKSALDEELVELRGGKEVEEARRSEADARVAELETELGETRDAREAEETRRNEADARAADLDAELEATRDAKQAEEGRRKEADAKVSELEAELEATRDAKAFAEARHREAIAQIQRQLEEEGVSRKLGEEKIDSLRTALERARDSLRKVEDDLASKKLELRSAIDERDSANNRLATFDKREAELVNQVRVMDEMRRGLHNKVLQLSGNIRVMVRVRPVLDEESVTPKSPPPARAGKRRPVQRQNELQPFRFPKLCDRDISGSDDVTKHIVEFTEPQKDRGGLKQRTRRYTFAFDNALPPSSSQKDVWEAVEPLVQSALDGYNVCLFAYGQTASGKTHTMVGEAHGENQGLIFRSCKKLFDAKREIESYPTGSGRVDISVELLEIYNEKVRDLLAPSRKDGDVGREISLRVNSSEAVGNVQVSTETEDDVSSVLALAQSRRCVKATNSNAESSRSHMLFTINFEMSSDEGSRSGKLHICDLAGSERLSKSGSNSVVGAFHETATRGAYLLALLILVSVPSLSHYKANAVNPEYVPKTENNDETKTGNAPNNGDGDCGTTGRRPSIALMSSPSRVDALVSWIHSHAASLTGHTFLVTEELSTKLWWNLRTPASLKLQTLGGGGEDGDGANANLGDEAFDILLAQRILEGGVSGVVFFFDPTTDESAPNLNLLLRACDLGGVPIALNEATAELALRGLARRRDAYLIFNPVAGQGTDPNAELAKIRSILEPQLSLHVVLTQIDRDPADQARELVNVIQARPPHRAATDGSDSDSDSSSASASSAIILASGGDGTVSAVAGATMDTGIPFGVIPRGTANAFSVALGIPTDLDAACKNILEGRVRVVDGAKANDTPMILLAGIGFEAGMVDRATRELKDKIGTLAYVLGGAQQLVQQEAIRCRVGIDGKESEGELEVHAIDVANVAPATSVLAQGFGEVVPDDGLLDVTISTGTGVLQGVQNLASLVASAVVRSPTESEGLLCVRAKRVDVSCDPPQKLVVDGEMMDMDPVTFTVLPNALKVLAPAAVA